MVVPDKSDPRWKNFVTNTKGYTFDNLAAKMLANRVHTMLSFDSSSEKINEAIEVAYNFFNKNAATVKTDLENIFGK
jgi:hypothetical protein